MISNTIIPKLSIEHPDNKKFYLQSIKNNKVIFTDTIEKAIDINNKINIDKVLNLIISELLFDLIKSDFDIVWVSFNKIGNVFCSPNNTFKFSILLDKIIKNDTSFYTIKISYNKYIIP